LRGKEEGTVVSGKEAKDRFGNYTIFDNKVCDMYLTLLGKKAQFVKKKGETKKLFGGRSR